jgi:hypothetical protein
MTSDPEPEEKKLQQSREPGLIGLDTAPPEGIEEAAVETGDTDTQSAEDENDDGDTREQAGPDDQLSEEPEIPPKAISGPVRDDSGGPTFNFPESKPSSRRPPFRREDDSPEKGHGGPGNSWKKLLTRYRPDDDESE